MNTIIFKNIPDTQNISITFDKGTHSPIWKGMISYVRRDSSTVFDIFKNETLFLSFDIADPDTTVSDAVSGVIPDASSMEAWFESNGVIPATGGGGGVEKNITRVLFRRSSVVQQPTLTGDAGVLTVALEENIQTNTDYFTYLAGVFTAVQNMQDVRISFDANVEKSGGGQGVELMGGFFVSVDGGVTYTQQDNSIYFRKDAQNASYLLTTVIADLPAGVKFKFMIGVPAPSPLGARLSPRSLSGSGFITTFTQPTPSASCIIALPI